MTKALDKVASEELDSSATQASMAAMMRSKGKSVFAEQHRFQQLDESVKNVQ